jgi:hypothetical protein
LTACQIAHNKEKIGKERRARWWCVGRTTPATQRIVAIDRDPRHESHLFCNLSIGSNWKFGNIELTECAEYRARADEAGSGPNLLFRKDLRSKGEG